MALLGKDVDGCLAPVARTPFGQRPLYDVPDTRSSLQFAIHDALQRDPASSRSGPGEPKLIPHEGTLVAIAVPTVASGKTMHYGHHRSQADLVDRQ